MISLKDYWKREPGIWFLNCPLGLPQILQTYCLSFIVTFTMLASSAHIRVPTRILVHLETETVSLVQLFATLWTVAHQAPLPKGFSGQEYWSGLPCPPPGDLPDLGIEPASLTSPALAGGFFTISATWEAPCCPLPPHDLCIL